MPVVSAFADDNDDLDDRYEVYEFNYDDDRRKTVKIAPELKARLRAVIQRTKDSLAYAERIIRKLEILVG